MTQNEHRGSDALAYLDSLLPETAENHLLEHQELFRIDLTQAMRDLRKETGLTQKDVAEKLGVTQSWVSKLESANNDHTFESFLAYLDALKADFEAVIYLGGKLFTRVPAGLRPIREKISLLSPTIANSEAGELPPFQSTLISPEQQSKYKEAQKLVASQGLWGTAA